MEKIKGYSKNMNVQMLIALMQAHGIRHVIVSPGTTHLDIVAGLQFNGNFEMYSTVDERGAAFMACGMAAENGEPVAIVCTESVASRNYFSAMTEAYYRQLPILAITALRGYAKIGHLHSQVIDRSISPKDTFRCKVHLPIIKDADDVWESNIMINNALLELRRNGGGPVHIDLPWSAEKDFSAKELCKTRVIRRYCKGDALPDIPHGKIAVFMGTHAAFTDKQTKTLDRFCQTYDSVVFCGHTSGYKGEYRVLAELAAFQKAEYDIFDDIDLLIHVGGLDTEEMTINRLKNVKEVWRINPDGEIRDRFQKLTSVFEMEDEMFFAYYINSEVSPKSDYLQRCLSLTQGIASPIEKLPFSNVYAAAILSKQLPENSLIHLGLSNTIRAWSLFEFPQSVSSSCNAGTRGIDGVMSTFLGASFVNKNRICFCVLGDLTFFYDMNAIGNRALGNNVRILLVNDGCGGLMKTNLVYKYMGDVNTNEFLAAAGHFGNQSPTLVKNYAENLGFEYLTASNKVEFEEVYMRFITPEMTDKPLLFEIFTKDSEEREAFDIMYNIDVTIKSAAKQAAKQVARQVLGQKGINAVKKVIHSDSK